MHISYNLHVRFLPVEADETEIEYGSCAQEDVCGKPELAENVAERPVAHEFVGEGEGHDEETDEQVTDGQGGDEPVLDPLQVPVDTDGHNDQGIAYHNDRHDDRYCDRGKGNVHPTVQRWVGKSLHRVPRDVI